MFDLFGHPCVPLGGSDDAGATDEDPTGGGAAGNDMVAVEVNQYDGGLDGGDGNLTRRTLPWTTTRPMIA